jgi:hypothetical protein
MKLVQESRMLNYNIMLNSILNLPSEDTLDGAAIFKIQCRGLPNSMCMTYQDMNHSIFMSTWFEKVRVGARQEVLSECVPHIVPHRAQKQSVIREDDSSGTISLGVLGWHVIFSTTMRLFTISQQII